MLKMIRTYVTVLFALIFIAACSQKEQESTQTLVTAEVALASIERIEGRFMDLINNNPGSPELNPVMLKLTEEYRIFGDQHPQHELAPEMLFRSANLRADGLGQYQSAINMFNRIIRAYPETPQAERSLFLIAYTYAEFLSDYEQARTHYERFLEQHPDSELAPSVAVMLEFLGMDINDLILNFEE